MTPKKDSDFYKLKQIHEKVCYLNGMPKDYILKTDKEPEFSTFKCHSRMITAAAQKKAYDGFLESWGFSHSAFFLAHPHDREALGVSCQLLRGLAKKGFKSFEFVSPFENLRFVSSEQEPIRDLYILVGANERDTEMTQKIRRWIRQPHGASVWVVGVAENPYKWASEEVGCVPNFMFWVKKSGMSVG